MRSLESGRGAKRLLVIVSDRLTDLVQKGELIDSYYNPGRLFPEVHLLLLNDDCPPLEPIQASVGAGVALHVHNLPLPPFRRTLGWRAPLIRPWLGQGVALAHAIRPDLVRAHDNLMPGFLASQIRERLGIRYVVSLHTVRDRDELRTVRDRFRRALVKRIEIQSLRHADAVIAVYAPILRYARAHGAWAPELIYNIVAGDDIRQKDSYRLHQPPQLITINRQLLAKNPENIIRAAKRHRCHYLVVGDGPLHDSLRTLALATPGPGTIEFRRAIPNKELCGMLSGFDVMLSHCDYVGLSKTLIEGALAGLPIIVNRHPVEPIPEYDGGWLRVCDNTPDGYGRALEELLASEGRRQELGQRALVHARANFSPTAMLERTLTLYRRVLAGGRAALPPPFR